MTKLTLKEIYQSRVVSKIQPGEWEYPAQQVGEFPTTRPTPQQAENDLLGATPGAITMIKIWDLAPIDQSSFDPFEPPGRPAGPINTSPPVVTGTAQVGGRLECRCRPVDRRRNSIHRRVASQRYGDPRRQRSDLRLRGRRPQRDHHRQDHRRPPLKVRPTPPATRSVRSCRSRRPISSCPISQEIRSSARRLRRRTETGRTPRRRTPINGSATERTSALRSRRRGPFPAPTTGR